MFSQSLQSAHNFLLLALKKENCKTMLGHTDCTEMCNFCIFSWFLVVLTSNSGLCATRSLLEMCRRTHEI